MKIVDNILYFIYDGLETYSDGRKIGKIDLSLAAPIVEDIYTSEDYHLNSLHYYNNKLYIGTLEAQEFVSIIAVHTLDLAETNPSLVLFYEDEEGMFYSGFSIITNYNNQLLLQNENEVRVYSLDLTATNPILTDIFHSFYDSATGITIHNQDLFVGYINTSYEGETQPVNPVIKFDITESTLGTNEIVKSESKLICYTDTNNLYINNVDANEPYTLYNINGQKLIEGTTTDGQTVVSISSLTIGLYIVKCGTNESFKILKK